MNGSFFDSNTLLYLATLDLRKIERVEGLLKKVGFISVQVLNEITNVARRKYQLSWAATLTLLFTVKSRLEVVPVTLDVHEAGLQYAERYGFAVYDSFIVAAALQAGCDTLWSEDMQDGLVIDRRLRIANPFAVSPR